MPEKGWSQTGYHLADHGGKFEYVCLALGRHREVDSDDGCVTIWM